MRVGVEITIFLVVTPCNVSVFDNNNGAKHTTRTRGCYETEKQIAYRIHLALDRLLNEPEATFIFNSYSDHMSYAVYRQEKKKSVLEVRKKYILKYENTEKLIRSR